MQYDSIILELMSRIKKLEDEVARLKTVVAESQSGAVENTNVEQPDSGKQSSGSYIKMTDQMIDLCYVMGKRAYRERSSNLWNLADLAARDTGMNRNTAFMYICAVKNMLEGVVYKRAINAKALRKYLSNILAEFGKNGLGNAVQATRLNVEYRIQCGIPSDSIAAICDEFQKKL